MAGILSASCHASPRKREYGHWCEVVSSNGKVYYYNRVTEQSQWIKPDGWEKAESIIFPVTDHGSGEESGFTDISQTDCAVSDDDMDVSFANSHTTSSPNSSIEGRPQSSKEHSQECKVVEEEEGEPYTPSHKYYRADLAYSLHEKYQTDEMVCNRNEEFRNACAYEMDYAKQQSRMFRARCQTRNAMWRALECKDEVSALEDMQNYLEETRQFFQANFDSEMRRIVKGPNRKEEEDTEKKKGECEPPAACSTPDNRRESKVTPSSRHY